MREIEEKLRQNAEDITKLVRVVMNITLHSQDNDRGIRSRPHLGAVLGCAHPTAVTHCRGSPGHG